MATVVLTGASAGIGAAAAIELTRRGHEVVTTGRSPSKLDAVHRRMLDAAPDGVRVPTPIVADFASLDEVRALAATVLERCPRIDVLANNAGLQTPKRETSAEGYELVLAVNHLAPFLLTDLLLDRVKQSGGRVVGTSSAVHRIGRIDFDDLQMEHKWSGMRSYGNSKLANVLFTSELAKRTGVPASCYHPGGVDTDLGRDSKLSSAAKPFMKWFARTPEKGADTLVWLATDAEGAAPTAVYYADRKPGKVSARAQDVATAARLWDVSADLVAR
jgi:NAD(P)-dependent dehydrogenase (short-subunit alcohol dehydrogenase family)